MVEAAILQLSWPKKSFHGDPLPLQGGTIIDAFTFRNSSKSNQDPGNEDNSQFRRAFRMGREFGVALVQLLRKRSPREVGAEPLVLTLVPGLFPTLCSYHSSLLG